MKVDPYEEGREAARRYRLTGYPQVCPFRTAWAKVAWSEGYEDELEDGG